MRNMVVVAVLALALCSGCATRIDDSGLTVVWGDASVSADCDGEQCSDTLTGGDMSEGLVGIVKGVVNAVVRLAGGFLPGVEPEASDHLTVELVTDGGE